MSEHYGNTDHKARVLIVDDEPQNRLLLEVMLGSDDYLLETADSGEKALALVAQHPPDLILLDVMMPGMDGYQVATLIKGDVATRGIAIILLTALDDRSSRTHGLSTGAEGFLTKPVDLAELRSKVKSVLAQGRR